MLESSATYDDLFRYLVPSNHRSASAKEALRIFIRMPPAKTPEKSVFQLDTSTSDVPLVPLLVLAENTCHYGKQQDGTRSISHSYTTQLDNLFPSIAPLAVSLEVVGEAERSTGAASGRTVVMVPAYSSATPASLAGRIRLSSRRYLVGQNQT